MKMNERKGFTLVELLAVIVILAIVLIIAVPGVLGIINKTKNNAYESQLKIIKEAAKNYIMEARDVVVWKENQTVVSLTEIQNRGLLEKKILDPRDKSELKHLAVVITRKGNQMSYDIVYTDPSDANYPRLSSNMIPIAYDGAKWIKANPTNENQSWFDYSKQQWANIATVSEDVRQSLLDAPVGTEVPMDKINTMFVWIPRYRYKLWNVDGTIEPAGNPHLAGDKMIDVRFETVETTKSMGTQNGEWLTHPAFTFGNEEVTGFWVAKFETGFADSQGNASYVGNETLENVVDASKVVIKPNVTTWRYSTLSNYYKTSRQMSTTGNRFGFSEETQAHMSKNMEWGAMAYLSSSTYGKTGNSNYTGMAREIKTNQTYITGHDWKDGGTYETTSGQGASTTGNITGIYDTNGGGFEYVMAVVCKKDTNEFILS